MHLILTKVLQYFILSPEMRKCSGISIDKVTLLRDVGFLSLEGKGEPGDNLLFLLYRQEVESPASDPQNLHML